MTDAHHCYQNAVAERVNGILKDEFDIASDCRLGQGLRLFCQPRFTSPKPSGVNPILRIPASAFRLGWCAGRALLEVVAPLLQ